MSLDLQRVRHLLVVLGGAATLSLVATGCPQTCPQPRHSGHGHHNAECGCPKCKGHGKGHGQRGYKYKKRGHRAKGQLAKFGAPKLLCAHKLAVHAKVFGLTDDQVAKLKAAKQAKHAAIQTLRPKVMAAAKPLLAEWQKDKPDAAKLQTLTLAFVTLKHQAMLTKLEYLLALQAALTPAQYKKVPAASFLFGRHGKGFHHRGRKGGCKGDCRGGCKGDCKGARGPRARKGHGRHGKGGCKMCKRMKNLGAPKALCPGLLPRRAARFGLSADQVAKLKALKTQKHGAMVDPVVQGLRSFVALKAEWLADQPDAAKIRVLAKALLALKMKGALAKVAFLVKVQGVLTPEQYKKVRDARVRRGNVRRGQGRRGHGRRGHGRRGQGRRGHGRKGGCGCGR